MALVVPAEAQASVRLQLTAAEVRTVFRAAELAEAGEDR